MRRRERARLATLVAVVALLAGCSGAGTSLPGGSGARGGATFAAASPSVATRTPTPVPAETPALGAQPVGPTEEARVVRVVDGDTIVVDRGRGAEKLRYIGIDSPETVAPDTPVQWMGPQATAADKALVDGKRVVLEKDVSETDQYGRLLRYVWLHDGGTWAMVNERLVEEGYAQAVTYPPDVMYVAVFLAAQERARAAGLGLWGATPPPAMAALTPVPFADRPTEADCDPAYPTVCIPPPPPDLDCKDIPYRRFKVLPPDPHHFDGSDHDGIGCESG